MPIVTISRGSYSRGKEVAEKVAKNLGYECISRDILLETLKEFHIPELKLVRALHDPPSLLNRFTFGKEKYIAYFQSTLLEQFQKDNVVYHGLAGHFFVKHVPHVLKVRIIADTEDRVKLEMKREGISESQARHILTNDDEARRKWSLHLYGIDTHDPSLYALVINIKKLSTDDAADIICHTVQKSQYQTTVESQRAMDDLALARRVKAHLVEHYPKVAVVSDGDVVHITLEGGKSSDESAIRHIVKLVPGVEKIDINLHPYATPD